MSSLCGLLTESRWVCSVQHDRSSGKSGKVIEEIPGVTESSTPGYQDVTKTDMNGGAHGLWAFVMDIAIAWLPRHTISEQIAEELSAIGIGT